MPAKRLFHTSAAIVEFRVQCQGCDWHWPNERTRGKSQPGQVRKGAVNAHVATTGHIVRTTVVRETTGIRRTMGESA